MGHETDGNLVPIWNADPNKINENADLKAELSKVLQDPQASKMLEDNLDAVANPSIEKMEEGKEEQNNLVVQRQPHWNTGPATTDQGPFQQPIPASMTYAPTSTDMYQNHTYTTPIPSASRTSAPETDQQGFFQQHQDQVHHHQQNRSLNLTCTGTNTLTNSTFSLKWPSPLITTTTPTSSTSPDSTTRPAAFPALTNSALPISTPSSTNYNPKKVFMGKYTNSVSPSAPDAAAKTITAPQSTFIPRRRDPPTTKDLEAANALLELFHSTSASPNIEAIKVKEEPLTTFEESQLLEKSSNEEDKENHTPIVNQPSKKFLQPKLSKAKAKATKVITVPNAAQNTKRKSHPKSADFEVVKKRRVLEDWTPEDLVMEGPLPSGMAEYCLQFLIKNNKLPAITYMYRQGVRVRIVKNDTTRMFLKYVGPKYDSAVYFYRDTAYKLDLPFQMTEAQALASQKVAKDLTDIIDINPMYTSKTNQKYNINPYRDVGESLKNPKWIKNETGGKYIVCDICEDANEDKTFTALTSFKNHLFSVHLGVKDFLCFLCEEAFTRKSSLLYHFMVHFDVWKFICDQCKSEGKPHTFRHKKHFREHLCMHYRQNHNKEPADDDEEIMVDTPVSNDGDIITFAIDRFNATSKKTTIMAAECVNMDGQPIISRNQRQHNQKTIKSKSANEIKNPPAAAWPFSRKGRPKKSVTVQQQQQPASNIILPLPLPPGFEVKSEIPSSPEKLTSNSKTNPVVPDESLPQITNVFSTSHQFPTIKQRKSPPIYNRSIIPDDATKTTNTNQNKNTKIVIKEGSYGNVYVQRHPQSQQQQPAGVVPVSAVATAESHSEFRTISSHQVQESSQIPQQIRLVSPVLSASQILAHPSLSFTQSQISRVTPGSSHLVPASLVSSQQQGGNGGPQMQVSSLSSSRTTTQMAAFRLASLQGTIKTPSNSGGASIQLQQPRVRHLKVATLPAQVPVSSAPPTQQVTHMQVSNNTASTALPHQQRVQIQTTQVANMQVSNSASGTIRHVMPPQVAHFQVNNPTENNSQSSQQSHQFQFPDNNLANSSRRRQFSVLPSQQAASRMFQQLPLKFYAIPSPSNLPHHNNGAVKVFSVKKESGILLDATATAN